jgi:hypothetical protein
MEERTREHIETAQQHQQLAQALLDPRAASGLPESRFAWAAVAAFYAAVHYIHGYLWERHRANPRSHPARNQRVRRDPILQRCEDAYSTLQEVSLRVRYSRGSELSEALARDLGEVDLAHVEATVTAAI